MNNTVHPVIYELPADYCLRIGQFITRWAYLEWLLRQTMYALMGTGPKLGRIALREPRVVDYVTMIEDAAGLRGVSISEDWSKLKDAAGKIEGWRDELAHGIWLDVPGAGMPSLQITSGKTVVKQGGQATKSRINPRAGTIELASLDKALAAVDHVVHVVSDMRTIIESQV